MTRFPALALVLVASVLPSPGARAQTAQSAAARPGPLPADADVVAEFRKRVTEYAALQKRAETVVAPMPKNATSDQLADAQQKLSHALVSARANAKAGDIFHPPMQAYVRRVLKNVFSRPDGKQLRASILDENPVGMPVRINGPYPDQIPLSTMPPQVLEVLPKLSENLEYRFIGDRLILFDTHAHLIVDYVDGALPRV
jgi:hypothetical protein